MSSSNNQTKKSVKASYNQSSKPAKNHPQPRTYLDNDDIRCVASPFFFGEQNSNYAQRSGRAYLGLSNPIITSSETKNVLLDRLEKEIISKLGGGFCRSSKNGEQTMHGNHANLKKSANNKKGKKRRRIHQLNDTNNETVQNELEKIEFPMASKNMNLNNTKVVKEKELSPITISEWIVRKRFVVGINQCTKILESAIERRNELQSEISLIPSREIENGSRRSAASTITILAPLPTLILLSRDVRPATILAHISIYAHMLKIPVVILPGKSSVDLGKVVGIRSVAVAMFLPSFGIDNLSEKEVEQLAIPGKNKGNWDREWKDCHQDVDSFVEFVKSKIPKLG